MRSVVESEHCFYDAAIVAQAGYFALSAEFAGGFEPTVKEAGCGFGDGELRQEYVAGALGLVIAVFLGQQAVERLGKSVNVGRLLREFYEPLVMSTLTFSSSSRSPRLMASTR